MTAVKFTFDDDFEGETNGTLRKDKLEDIRDAAYAEGLEAGRTEIMNSLEQSCTQLMQNISVATENLHMRQDEQISLMNKESAKLAHAIIEKLAPALVNQTPLAEIELLVQQCLKNSPLEPRLVIRIDEAILPALEEKIDGLKQENGFPGKVILISEPMANISDCRVEWANGGAERNFDKLLETIESTLQLFIEAPEETANHSENQINPEAGTISETITS